nr:MAG: RNA-dependent RNA polymerase [Dracophyllum associated botourmia-like virus 115]
MGSSTLINDLLQMTKMYLEEYKEKDYWTWKVGSPGRAEHLIGSVVLSALGCGTVPNDEELSQRPTACESTDSQFCYSENVSFFSKEHGITRINGVLRGYTQNSLLSLDEDIKHVSSVNNSVLDVGPNPYSVLGDTEDGTVCLLSGCLWKKAKTLVRLFKNFGITKVNELPSYIKCGELRTAVRQCFSNSDPLLELSFKTIQKIEDSCCKTCLPRFEEKLSLWKDNRYLAQEVDIEHLRSFGLAFSRNVGRGWDRRRKPFIPNGHATLNHTRREGGNWNVEEFSDECRAELVFSSGKPRVVTCYSSQNTRILAPLHYSLSDHLRRKGWLLTGNPTSQHISSLNGGDYLSFDYSSATDNIKAAYVREAVRVLIDQAGALSDDELEALRVFSELRIRGVEGVATIGQPMGSVLSFPLLCLINKTVVDMSMNDLLQRGEVTFSEWSGHRCLINGDDLLLREPRSNTDIRSGIEHHGGHVGLIVNLEKTMRDSHCAEINSTFFRDCEAKRKFNAASLWMKPDVNDVLGFAAQSTPCTRTFCKVVKANLNILRKQQDKMVWSLPAALQSVCRRDKKIRAAITCGPVSVRPRCEGVIRVTTVPDDYDLSVEEEHLALSLEIDRVRDLAIDRCSAPRIRFKTGFRTCDRTYSSSLRKPLSLDRNLTLLCYKRFYEDKKREALKLGDLASSHEDVDTDIVSDLSKGFALIDFIRSKKLEKSAVCPWTESQDFVSFG